MGTQAWNDLPKPQVCFNSDMIQMFFSKFLANNRDKTVNRYGFIYYLSNT